MAENDEEGHTGVEEDGGKKKCSRKRTGSDRYKELDIESTASEIKGLSRFYFLRE